MYLILGMFRLNMKSRENNANPLSEYSKTNTTHCFYIKKTQLRYTLLLGYICSG